MDAERKAAPRWRTIRALIAPRREEEEKRERP
jgi:hypothetical protein